MKADLLIVDDYHDTLSLMEKLFAMEGREVRTAASGAEAIARMLHRPASIVWIDEDLPDFKGVDLALHIKAVAERNFPGSPCITLAVRGDCRPGESPDMTGFDHFIAKPVDFTRLDSLLARLDTLFQATKVSTGER